MSTIPLEHVANEGVEAALARRCRDGEPDHRGVVDLHDLCGGVSLLPRPRCGGPTPKEVLEIPYFGTVCLLSSSLFILLAERAIEHGRMAAFRLWWRSPFCWARSFSADTAMEWYKLIVHDHLTISTNLFGTTFYSLVGLHASHVIVGLLMMLVVASSR